MEGMNLISTEGMILLLTDRLIVRFRRGTRARSLRSPQWEDKGALPLPLRRVHRRSNPYNPLEAHLSRATGQ